MRDSIFLLRCVDCDAAGLLSQLWLRGSFEMTRGGSEQVQHYVECMHCGAHLKNHHNDRMEPVTDEEWSRRVGEFSAALRPGEEFPIH